MSVQNDTTHDLEAGDTLRRSQDGHIVVQASPEGRLIRASTEGNKVPLGLPINDIYGVKVEGPNLIIKTCPRIPSMTRRFCSTSLKPVKDPYARYMPKLPHVLKFSNDIEAGEWATYLHTETRPSYSNPLGTSPDQPRKLLVIVNPIGGKGKGMQIFTRLLKPMMEDAGIPYELIVTQAAQHGVDIAREFDSASIGAICVVGGDGLFSEVLNGMYSRSDWETVVKFPIGVIPAGSSNCLACSIGMRQLLAAAFAVVRGDTRPLDVLKVHLSKEEKNILSVCGVSYGFISEVNTHAGKWRWLLGPSRYSFCGVRTLLKSPMKYHVDCRYLPGDHTDEEYAEKFASTVCGPDCIACAEFAKTDRGIQNDAPSDQGWVEGAMDLNPRRKRLNPGASDIDPSTMLLFSITNVSIRQSQNQAVWNPYCHMASGCMDLVMMPVISRIQLIKFFATFSKANNQHLSYNRDIFSVIKAKSVEMNISAPVLPDWEKNIQIAIDGEVFPLQPLRVDSMHALLNIMCL